MLDKLLSQLPRDKAQAGAVIIRLRPPDLEAMSAAPDDDAEAAMACESCPICGDEHEPLDLPPDVVMVMAHLVKQLADEHDETEVDDEADDDDEGGDDDVAEGDDDVHDGLHLMPKR